MTSQNQSQPLYKAGIYNWPLKEHQTNPQLEVYWSIKIPHSDVRKKPQFNHPLHNIFIDIDRLTICPAKKFKYTAPVLQIQETEYKSTALLSSRVYHYLATPGELKTRVSTILTLRAHIGVKERPIIIWEPSPLVCKPETLQSCLEAAALVDVFSPNHIELAHLFRHALVAPDEAEIEGLALDILKSGVGPGGEGVVVIRAGENGCLVQSRRFGPVWIPPFYDSGTGEGLVSKVVDPTGAGNSFLGGFSVGLVQTGGDVIQAAWYGSVAASFALEQVGMPVLDCEGDGEVWNGVSVHKRLLEYKARRGHEIDWI
jgi:hypothetical protein